MLEPLLTVSQLEEQVAGSEKLEDDILVRKKTLEMLPSAADNIGEPMFCCSVYWFGLTKTCVSQTASYL